MQSQTEFHNSNDQACQLLLGRAIRQSFKPIGFHSTSARQPDSDLITYSGNGHLFTCAPTRSGKGTGICVPNALTYNGPMIVFDPKGENYLITARARRAMGQQVIKIDPFGCIEDTTDSMNPLDGLNLPQADIETDSQTLAEMMTRNMKGSREPFWDNAANGLLSAMIMVAATRPAADQRLGWAFDLLTSDDVVYNLAVLLDTCGKTLPQPAHREIAAFLQTTDVTRSGILSTAQSYIKQLSTSRVRRAFESSTFSLRDVVDGKPLSIYLILPGERIQSHASLLKLWLATLFRAILARTTQPEKKTLFLLDEMGQLGGFPFLEMMITLCAGYGLWVWMIYQDLAQLQSAFPGSWKTLLNNCEVLQVFGINNRQMATGWSEYFDSVHVLHRLRNDEQLIRIRSLGDLHCQRVNYLTDELFRFRFDNNRLHSSVEHAARTDFDPEHEERKLG